MNDVQRAMQRAAEVFGSEAESTVWIQLLNAELDYKTPLEVVEAGGLERVLDILNSDDWWR